MLIVSKCLKCGRGYTARVTSCQICGGDCVPVEPRDAAIVLPRNVQESEPPPSPKSVCPCCDGAPGPHSIEQTSRHLTDVSLVPMKRTYLVTTVKIPGVCNSCHRTIEKKRYFADALTPLPLIIFFVILVIADKPAFAVPVLAYLIYLARWLTYSWADFVLYGQDLSWQLDKYMPAGEKESQPRYYAGWLHGLIRIGLYPALVLVLGLLGLLIAAVFPKDKGGPAKGTAAPSAAIANAVEPEKVATRPAAPAPTYAPSVIAPPKMPVEEALRIFRMTPLFAVPVDSETLTHPKLGRPATSPIPRRRLRSAVTIYYDESKVPPQTPYELMSGPAVLANFAKVHADGLSIGIGQTVLTPAEVSELAAKIGGSIEPPSAIKLSTGH